MQALHCPHPENEGDQRASKENIDQYILIPQTWHERWYDLPWVEPHCIFEANSTDLEAQPGSFLSVSMEGWWHSSKPLHIHKELS